jgi:hypothetical protein
LRTSLLYLDSRPAKGDDRDKPLAHAYDPPSQTGRSAVESTLNYAVACRPAVRPAIECCPSSRSCQCEATLARRLHFDVSWP